MTNFEKYIDDFIFASAENDLCAGFIEPVILNPRFIYCQDIKCEDCRKMVKDFMQEEYKGAPVDWSKVAVDTPIFVRDYETVDWTPRYFARYENGKIFAWKDGTTSFTNQGERPIEWAYAKLAEEKPT